MEKSDDPVALATVAPLAPITSERPVGTDLESSIPSHVSHCNVFIIIKLMLTILTLVYDLKIDMARAMAAPDTEHPNGTPDHPTQGWSVLQQHVAFFDQDNDGILYPWETYIGIRAIGFNVLFAFILTLAFHITFSYPTLPGYIPSLLLPIYIENIHKGKHPSDSGTYDTEGRYMPANFKSMFSKYGKTSPDKLTFGELWNMTEGNRLWLDLVGWVINKFEWGLVYFIAKDEEGYLSKEAMRGVFDGSLFYNLANKKNASMDKKMS